MGDHISKTLVLGDAQTLFVNIGSASNACQVANRKAQSPGVSPCPDLTTRAGVWKFDPSGTNQAHPARAVRPVLHAQTLRRLAKKPANGVWYASSMA